MQAQHSEEISRELLQRCRCNDPAACEEFFNRYQRKIFNTAYRILGEESSAEDAVQETLLNIYRGISSFRGDSKVSTWVSRITVNVCLGMLRKGKNRQYVDLDDKVVKGLCSEATSFTDPMTHALAEELKALIRDAFNRMSKKQKAVVRLHDLQGYTIQEIAKILGCPAGTVKSRLFYGRQEFKAIFTSRLNGALKTQSVSIN